MLLYIYLFLFLSTIIFYMFNKNLHIYNYGIKTTNSYNILIVGGTHGNEPASSLSLYRLARYLKHKNIRNSFITIIPMVNKTGFYTNNRYNNHFLKNYDINRNYPKKYYINTILSDMIKEYDMIIDHHEGYNYHVSNKNSIGSTISPVNFETSMLDKILNKLNKHIKSRDKKFVFNSKHSYPIGSLRNYIVEKFPKKKYLLIETTGITNRDTMYERQFKALYIILSILLDKDVIAL